MSEAEDRPSAIDPAKALERRVPPFFALFFYGFPAAAAWVLLYNGGHPRASAEMWSVGDPARSAGAGLGLAAVLLLLRWIALRTLRRARALESEFGWIVGRQRKWECVFLALLSGAAEEYLFRGWLQATVGVWLAALLFAVLHWPVNRNFLLWPPFAFAAGLAFGWATAWTGNLWAAATAHAVYNGVSLWRLTDRFGDWDQAAVDRYVQAR